MKTVALVNDEEGFILERQFMGDGFDEYFDDVTGGDAEVVGRLPLLLSRLTASEQPFFLWLHLWAAHAKNPMDAANVSGYEPALRRADEHFGGILRALDGAQRDDLVVVVTSDHGEGVAARYRSHGSNLSDQELRVPILVSAPGLQAQRIRTPVSNVDIVPTLLGLTKTPGAAALPGRSLLGHFDGSRSLLASVWNRQQLFGYHAAFDGRYKVQYRQNLRQWTAFDANDNEPLPLGSIPEAARPLATTLERYLTQNEAHLQF
jgi:arylsulfatase A-like enzyme